MQPKDYRDFIERILNSLIAFPNNITIYLVAIH